jgi:hypothetical protein
VFLSGFATEPKTLHSVVVPRESVIPIPRSDTFSKSTSNILEFGSREEVEGVSNSDITGIRNLLYE